MAILWLILKIILSIILILLGIIVIAILVILFCPIKYQIAVEKYREIEAHVQMKVFYFLHIEYVFEDHENKVKIRCFGIPIKKLHLSPHEMKEAAEDVVDSAKTAVKAEEVVAEETTASHPEKVPVSGPDRTSQVESQDEQKTSSKVTGAPQQTKQKEVTNSAEKIDWISGIKTLWESPYRHTFFRLLKQMGVDFWKGIKPDALYFDLLIGMGDPAEIGELIAKLTMLSPWMYRYGKVEGEYMEKGAWGEVCVLGQLQLYIFLKAMLKFAINKEVRNYIKIILNVRKVKINGI